MFIHVARDHKVALAETQDFKRFKLVIDGLRQPTPGLKAALTGIATLDSDGHAWVSETWLRGRDPAPSWQEGLTAMIAVARKYGWVNEGDKSVRAHIEWTDEPGAKA